MRIDRKVITAIISSFGIVVVEGVLLNFIKWEGLNVSISGGGIAFSLLVLSIPIVIVSWGNSYSWILTTISVLAVLGAGLPLTWIVLAPFTEQLILFVIPDKLLAQHLWSASFFNILVLTVSVMLIELISDNGWRKGRRFGLVLGTVLGLIITISIEMVTGLITQNMVHTSNARLVLDFLRTLLYAPVLWGLVVWGTNAWSPRNE